MTEQTRHANYILSALLDLEKDIREMYADSSGAEQRGLKRALDEISARIDSLA